MTKTAQPLAEAKAVAGRFLAEIMPYCHRAELAGSVRRGVAMVGDIEIVALPKFALLEPEAPRDLFGKGEKPDQLRINLLWMELDKEVPLSDRLKKWGEKYRKFMYHGVQIDLFTAERGNWGWIHLIRTGSAAFSHGMAGALNKAGYTSLEGWVTTIADGHRVETPTEDDVFKLARRAWVPPEERSWEEMGARPSEPKT